MIIFRFVNKANLTDVEYREDLLRFLAERVRRWPFVVFFESIEERERHHAGHGA
jgi:hypothetical protein